MGRIYTVEFEGSSITNALGDYDLFELTAADDQPIKIVGLFLNQSSEVGDAQDEKLRIQIIRGHTTSGIGTATTPQPVDPGSPAASFSAEVLAGTPASAGTPVELHSDIWPIHGGFGLWWIPRTEPKTTQSAGLLCVRLMAAVVDDITASGTVYVEEG